MELMQAALIVHGVLFLLFNLFITFLFFGSLKKRSVLHILFFAGLFSLLFVILAGCFAFFAANEVAGTIGYSVLTLSALLFEAGLLWKVKRERAVLEGYKKDMAAKVDEATRELSIENEQYKGYFQTWAKDSKTPLFIIQNTLDLLKRKSGITEETKIIDRQLKRLNKNTGNYLKSHKMAKHYDNITLFDLSRIFREKAALYKEAAREKNVKLIVEADPGLYLKADSKAVEAIIENLIDNALKYTDMGSIEAVLKQDDKQAFLTIKDTGTGIAEGEQENIFKKFYRSADKSKEGSGMGLFVVRDLVTGLKGLIRVDSKEGTGTVFTIAMPLYFPGKSELSELSYSAPEAPIVAGDAAPAEIEETTEIDENKNTLFIACGDQDILSYFYSSLQDEYNVFLFQSAGQLLTCLQNLPRADLILSDITLQDGSGVDLLRSIRKICLRLPFMLITPHASDATKEQSLNEGATDFIESGFSIAELKAKIRNFILISENADQLTRLSKVDPEVFAEDVKKKSDFYKLSKRQKDFLVLYLQDRETGDIARELDVSPNTVRRHKMEVCNKLKCEDRHNILRMFGYTSSVVQRGD